jgi:hypothetical protein
MRKNYPSFEDKFWSKVDKGAENECWIWTGAKRWNGYGKFIHNYKTILAHKASFEINRGTIGDGLVVCHSCDNRACCNPNHLWLGTQAENMQDMFKKGRNAKSKPKGSCERHPRAKLKNSDIPEIKKLYSNGESSRSIGKKYGVSKTMILFIVKDKNWKHLDWKEEK